MQPQPSDSVPAFKPVPMRANAGVTGICLWGKTGVGKTATVQGLNVGYNYTPEEYSALHQGKDVQHFTALEGYQLLGQELSADEPDCTVLDMPTFYLDDATQQQQKWRKQVRLDIHRVYKHQCVTNFQYRPLQFGLPLTGGFGDVGSPKDVMLSGAQEPHLVVSFITLDDLLAILAQYLQIVAGTVEKGSMDDLRYYSMAWQAATVPGSDATKHAQGYRKQQGQYSFPIKPWVKKLLGRNYLCRTRGAHAPDLHMEQLYLSHMILLLMPRTVDRQATADQQAAGPATAQQLLLRHLRGRDPSGPWKVLQQSQDKSDMDALLVCLSKVWLFTPNHLICGLKTQIVDCVGVGDDNAYRIALQRQIQERVPSLLVMVNRDLESGGVYKELLEGPFLARLVDSHLNPDAMEKLSLHIMVSLEAVGLPPPANASVDEDDEDAELQHGSSISVDYWLRHKDYIQSRQAAIVETIRKQLVQLLTDYFAVEPHPDAKRLIPELAKNINVFHAMPNLGVMASLQLGPNPTTANGRTVPEMQEVLAASNLSQLVSVLAQPWVEQQTGGTSEQVEEIEAKLDEARSKAELYTNMHEVLDAIRALNLHKSHSASKRGTEQHFVGEGSAAAQSFHNQFEQELLKGILEPGLRDFIESLTPIVTETVLGKIMQRVEAKCGRGRPAELATMLAPAYRWQHEQLPLASWVPTELRRAVKFDGLAHDLLTDKLLSEVKTRMRRLVVDVVVAYYGAVTDGEVNPLVNTVLDSYFNWDQRVEEEFQRAFFTRINVKPKGRVKQHNRLLEQAVDRVWSAPEHRFPQIMAALQAAVTVAPSMPVALQHVRSHVSQVLRRMLFALMDQRRGVLSGMLYDYINNQFKDLRRRLVESWDSKQLSLLVSTFRRFAVGWEAHTADLQQFQQALDDYQQQLAELRTQLAPEQMAAKLISEHPKLSAFIEDSLKLAAKRAAEAAEDAAPLSPGTQQLVIGGGQVAGPSHVRPETDSQSAKRARLGQ